MPSNPARAPLLCPEFLAMKISYKIRHCKFVLQGASIFLKRKKRKTTCSFQIGTKNPTKKKFIVEPSFFTSWTMTSEKCTRAHVQENKSIYIYIYISVHMKTFLKTAVYIYIYLHRSSGFTSNHRFIATELFRMVQGPHSSGNFDDFCEVIADAPQSIESSALRNTFYSKNEFIYIYIY